MMARPYRPGLGQGAALAEILNGRDRLYDAKVVDACFALLGPEGWTFSGVPMRRCHAAGDAVA